MGLVVSGGDGGSEMVLQGVRTNLVQLCCDIQLIYLIDVINFSKHCIVYFSAFFGITLSSFFFCLM
jgi:hypothetical protein